MNCDLSTYDNDTLIFAAETEPDKLQEMAHIVAAVDRWYDANGMKRNHSKYQRLMVMATYKLRNQSSFVIIQRYQLVMKASLSLVSPFTTRWNSINRSPTWKKRNPTAFSAETLEKHSTSWVKTLINHLLPSILINVLIFGISVVKPHPIMMEKVKERALRFVLKDKSSSYTELLKKLTRNCLIKESWRLLALYS